MFEKVGSAPAIENATSSVKDVFNEHLKVAAIDQVLLHEQIIDKQWWHGVVKNLSVRQKFAFSLEVQHAQTQLGAESSIASDADQWVLPPCEVRSNESTTLLNRTSVTRRSS